MNERHKQLKTSNHLLNNIDFIDNNKIVDEICEMIPNEKNHFQQKNNSNKTLFTIFQPNEAGKKGLYDKQINNYKNTIGTDQDCDKEVIQAPNNSLIKHKQSLNNESIIDIQVDKKNNKNNQTNKRSKLDLRIKKESDLNLLFGLDNNLDKDNENQYNINE